MRDPQDASSTFARLALRALAQEERSATRYLLVNSDIVRQTIKVDLPDIVRVIRGELLDS